jgi:hypothetical protein
MTHAYQTGQLDAPPQDLIDSEYDALEFLPLFEHSPLSREVSPIRLVRILQRRSPEGNIRCEVSHATTTSTYVCLSYVWGGPDNGGWIILNGHRFWVRENLLHFLQAAHRKPQIRNEWLWIDALSIDQANNAERNHQVQQMGLIYSSAKGIISWLGRNKKIEQYFTSILLGKTRSRQDRVRFECCEYWKRAWVSQVCIKTSEARADNLVRSKITQEFVLARQRTFMAGNSIIDNDRVPHAEFENPANYRVDRSRATRYAGSEQLHGFIGKGLFHLLETLPEKRCSIPRDRIFSLLALCGNDHGIRVDYEISAQALASNILRLNRDSFCLCSASIIDHTLRIEDCPREDDNQTTALIPFAYMRFPLVRYLELTDRWPQVPCIKLDNDNGSGNAQTVLSIIIPFPNQVCALYNGQLTIYIYPLTNRTFDSAIDNITYNYTEYRRNGITAFEFPQPMHGCSIELSNHSDLCIIRLSLDMLLELSRVPHSRSTEGRRLCCGRVNKERFTEVPGEHILHLYPGGSDPQSQSDGNNAEEQL